MVSVQDLGAEALHLILVRRLDYRPPPAPPVGRVAVFSEPTYGVLRTERVQLATPAYYREEERLKPGIGDVHDGTLTKDSIRWAKRVVPAGTVTGSTVSFASSREPRVYCASHYRWYRELHRLKDHFAEEYWFTKKKRFASQREYRCGFHIRRPRRTETLHPRITGATRTHFRPVSLGDPSGCRCDSPTRPMARFYLDPNVRGLSPVQRELSGGPWGDLGLAIGRDRPNDSVENLAYPEASVSFLERGPQVHQVLTGTLRTCMV